jgi:drug/metabolite transporter (DMT)-like permease
MISTPVVLMVLLSALMHAGWNLLIKASRDRLLDAVGLAIAASLVSALLLPWVPLPAAESRPWLAVSVFLQVGYFVTLVASYRDTDLSLAYPLMRGTAPVLVACFAPLLGEPASPGLIAGIGLVSAGILMPAWLGARRGTPAAAEMRFALGNSFIIALYTVIDGIGVRLSGNALSYALWLFFLYAWGVVAVAWWRRGFVLYPHLRQRWPVALAGAALSLGSYGIVLWAMSVAAIPAVAALRECSVVLAVLLGSLFLKEPMGRVRIAGAVLVVAGTALIRFG